MSVSKRQLVFEAVDAWFADPEHEGVPSPISEATEFARHIIRQGYVTGPLPSASRYVRLAVGEALSRASNSQEFRDLQKDAQKWRNFDREVLSLMGAPVETGVHWPEWDGNIYGGSCVVFSPTDLHVGKLGVDGYNIDKARDQLMLTADRLVADTYGADNAVLVLGNDWFHVDTPSRTTTRGTPQDSEEYARVIEQGVQIAEDLTLMMSASFPQLDVLTISSNHCETGDIWLPHVLRARHAMSEGVQVHAAASRMYMEHGRNMFAFEHGDGPKPSDLAKIAARERRDMWGRTHWCTWFLGHLHHLKEWDDGAMICQLPSLSGTDKWHHKRGYVLSEKAAVAYLFDEKLGQIARYMAIV